MDSRSAVDFLRLAKGDLNMSDWLHNLPIVWMTLVIFGFTFLLATGIYALVTALAKGERARAFKVISPGMLPPLGIIFGLFVAFTAAQVWNDNDGPIRRSIEKRARLEPLWSLPVLFRANRNSFTHPHPPPH